MFDIPEQEIPQFRDHPPLKQRQLCPVGVYADFRPGIDVVVRRGSRCFIVDTWHQYADIEVQSDQLTSESVEWYRGLTGRHRANMAYATWYTYQLSWPGKLERLEAMGIGLVFEVLDTPNERKEE